jgi:hypothetical protein
MKDSAAEWDSLPAQAPPEAPFHVDISGTSASMGAPAPPKNDSAAEWDAIPTAAAPAAPAAPKAAPGPAPLATEQPIDLSKDDLLREASRGAAEMGTHFAKGTAQLAATAAGNIYDVARGGSLQAPLTSGQKMSDWIGGLGGEPQTYVGRYGNQAMDWLFSLPGRLGGKLADVAAESGAPPAVSALLAAGPAVALALAGGRAKVPRETIEPRVEPGATTGTSPGTVAGTGAGGGAAGQQVPAGAVAGGPSGSRGNAGAGAGGAAPGVPSVPAGFEGIATPAEQLPAAAQLSSPARQFFPSVKKSTIGADLPETAQAERAQVMQAVGIDPTDGFREGALKGNPKTQASEVMTGETPGPLGNVYQKKFADEQNALRSYAQDIKDAAGGTQSGPELPQEQAAYLRGQNIVKPLDMLDQFYNQRASDLYAQARANGAASVQSTQLDGLLKNSDFRQTLIAQGKRPLLDALDAQVDRFHTEGWGDQQGPNTVGAAEAFRQWLNQTGTAETGRAMSQVKQALDNDVAQAGGAETFKAARAMWQQYKETLGDPKGISSLLEDDKGNRTVPFNQVPQKIAGMQDLDQFKHVIDTLKGIRNIEGIDPAIVDASNNALREVRQQFAESAVNAGATTESWNPRNFNKTVNANAFRMGQVFTPAELQRFRTLNDAGFVLENQTRYPGAVVQGLSLVHRGAIQLGAGAAGAAAELAAGGGMSGGAAAGFVGNRMGAFLTDRMGMARAQQLQRQMRSNAEKYFPGANAP